MRNALITAAALALAAAPAAQADNAQGFWERLETLCGQAFEGALTRAPEGDATFGDARLVMHVRSCEDGRIRIPFVAGDDLSRTWVLTRRDDGRIELRHDHRHEDGSEERVTQYGGVSPSPGGEWGQIFPADARTTDILPTGWPNVWMMEVHPGERFVYFVQRLGTERAFRVEFDLTETVAPPPAPWGWED